MNLLSIIKAIILHIQLAAMSYHPVMLLIIFLYFFSTIPLTQSNYQPPPANAKTSQPLKFSPEQLEACFSQLSGRVEEFCPDIEDIHTFNQDTFLSLVTEIVERPYFRYYQANLSRTCRFWSTAETCTQPDCQLECCEDTEVPAYQVHPLCSDNSHPSSLGVINRTLSPALAHEISQWETHSIDICFEDQESLQEDINCSFYDLHSNREQYTAYNGPDANKVWKSIYKENCFLPPGTNKSYKLNRIFTESSLANLCIEKRAFYRLISGLHASISLHLCQFYKLSCAGVFSKDQWGPNLNEFYRRFNPGGTDQLGPSWLRNVYFAFLVELNALSRVGSDISSAVFYTGKPSEDLKTQALVGELLDRVKESNLHFDEKRVFFAELHHVPSIRDAFSNITRIIDCVTCQRCKLWGKLQTRAIATSLKILFSSHLNSLNSYPPSLLRSLRRDEIVALFNGVAQLAKSISFIESHRRLFC